VGKPVRHGREKSDGNIVPVKLPNNAARAAAEAVEGRTPAEGNTREAAAVRTQSREAVERGLKRVREAAARDRNQRFTALFHHVYSIDTLRTSFFALRRDSAAGIDGETWQSYAEDLEARLLDLSERLRKGTFRVSPVGRAYIPKSDGRLRPIGVPTLEDKLVQRAMTEVMNAIYDGDFFGFSYGFRPKRSQHQALDALTVAITREPVNWVLDADIRSFFDTLSHEWLVRFVEHRIADKRVLHLIQAWLKAGVLENGSILTKEEGTVQGGSISPLLANIYLHYVLDLWVDRRRRIEARGPEVIVRYADDFVMGFKYQADAEQFLDALKERLAAFALELHPEKTRLIEFGRFAAERRGKRGERRPETFNFLGFTHICGKDRNGRYLVIRHTMRERMRKKLEEVRETLKRKLHSPIPEIGRWLGSVVRGHVQYYGVPNNGEAIGTFRWVIGNLWRKALMRRSQRHRATWKRMEILFDRHLPPARICHPWPQQRFDATT
jgi:RNA-directed DNA polymerase